MPRSLKGRHRYITRKSSRHIECRRINAPLRGTVNRRAPRFGNFDGTGVRRRLPAHLPSGSIAGGEARSPSQAHITWNCNGNPGSFKSERSRFRVQLLNIILLSNCSVGKEPWTCSRLAEIWDGKWEISFQFSDAHSADLEHEVDWTTTTPKTQNMAVCRWFYLFAINAQHNNT